MSFIVPSTQAAFAIFIAREILCFKKLPALGSSVHMLRFLQSLLKKSPFPHTHLCRSHIFDPSRNPIAILSCWFDSFNLKFLHGMTFNHWEPNLSWNALNFFTSVGSSRKIKSAISLSKIGSVQFFWISFSRAISIFPRSNHRLSASSYVPSTCSKPKISLKASFAPTAEAKKAGKASRRAEETPKLPLAAEEMLVKTGYYPFSR